MELRSAFSSRLTCSISAIGLAISLAASTATLGQSMVQNWQGMAGPGFVPPDPHGAPVPQGVIATVNLQISYFNKVGGVVWGPTALAGTFFPANTGTGNQNSDPKVIFDSDSRRFFVIMQENHTSTFWLNVAVSRSADPRSSGANDWIIYRLNATELAGSNTAGGINYGGDYDGKRVS